MRGEQIVLVGFSATQPQEKTHVYKEGIALECPSCSRKNP